MAELSWQRYPHALTMGLPTSPVPEETDAVLPRETEITFSDGALSKTMHIPPESPLVSTFVYQLLFRLKYQKTLQDEMHNISQE